MFIRLARGALAVLCLLSVLAGAGGCTLGGGGVAALHLVSRATTPFENGGPPAAPLAHTVSGPYRSNNLTVYLIHGDEQAADWTFRTLADAMAAGAASVDDTGSVNQLHVNNGSDADLFVPGGQIVRGGRQDRTLAFDVVVPPKSDQPIDAFCVEHGRWNGRAGESAAQFARPGGMIGSSKMKQAVMDRASQGDVWNAVTDVQAHLAAAVRRDVAAPESPTSFQLTLENPTVRSWVGEYTTGLGSLATEHPDAIGYACLVNGQLSAVEVYGSRRLFRQLWPEMLSATAVESLAALREGPQAKAEDPQAVSAFVKQLDAGAPSTRKINDLTTARRYDCAAGVMFQTTRADGAWLHRCYLPKGMEGR